MYSLERMIAGRYLRSKRRDGFVSVIAGFSFLGIMLGVAVLIVVMSVMNGFRHDLMHRILGVNGHMGVYGYVQPLTDYDGVAHRIAQTNGVTFATPVVEGQVMLSVRNRATGVMVRSQSVNSIQTQPLLSDNLNVPDWSVFRDGQGVIVGDGLLKRYGLRIGDRVTLISPKFGKTAFGAVPRLKAYSVAGTFNVGMYEYDNNFVYMDFAQGQVFFKKQNTADYVQIITDNADNLTPIINAIAIPQGAVIRTWQERNGALFNALAVERNVMMLILALIIVVAAFNVISGQIMLVNDKSRSIAILRTVGASRGSIMAVFLMTGSFVGVVGTAFGAVLGLAFAHNIQTIREFLEGLSGSELFSAEIYFLSKLPSRIEPSQVVGIVGFAMVISILASVYPAFRASKTDPAEVLRHE